MRAAEHLDERALAGPVLAYQGKDLGPAQFKRDVLQGMDAWERFIDPSEFL